MGLLSLTFSLSMLIAPLAGNWLYGAVGPEAFWPIVGSIAVLTAFGFWALKRTLSPPPAAAGDLPPAV
jgi:hypothetical protein